MKSELSQYVKSVFQALGIDAPFDVYACESDSIPEWLRQQTINYEFVVCCDNCSIKERLSKFIKKDISEIDNHLYWFEGMPLANNIEPCMPKESPKDESRHIEQLKTSTRLATWIDDVIFKKIQAVYAPDHILFESNLNLSEDNSRRYLGTYFPRSYAESFCIFSNIFHNRAYKSKFSDKRSISILSIGCGSGGDLMGLLTAIEKVYTDTEITHINIWAIDGNQQSLGFLNTLLDLFARRTTKTIKYKLCHQVFSSMASLDLSDVECESLDFIISAKVICELIASGKGLLDNSYYDFAIKLLPKLSDIGLCLILDVTTRTSHTTFNPILMNRQINQALRDLKIFKTLLPLSCFYYGEQCDIDCFYQKVFTVKHSRFAADKSKVTYRVLGREGLAKAIISQNNSHQLVVQNNRICPYSSSFELKQDAYYLLDEVQGTDDLSTDSSFLNIPVDVTENTQCEEDKDIQEEMTFSETESADSKDEDYYEGCYVIDTNVFADCPDIISKISEDYYIVLSATVIEELDHLKTKKNIPASKKKKVSKAIKFVNESFETRDIETEFSDTSLLPKDYEKTKADNKILSVALKHIDYNPILLTSDNALQVKAKGLGIKTISLKEYLKQNQNL